jgi:hypothetical protein
MLVLAVPAMSLVLFVLTKVEEWLLHGDDAYLRANAATDASDAAHAQALSAPPGEMSEAA